MTLNRDKCQFKMSHLVFMGEVLSARGIGPADVKLKAVTDACEPTNAAEVRNFLRMINFTARFIPHLSASLQKMENLLCRGRNNSNRLTS